MQQAPGHGSQQIIAVQTQSGHQGPRLNLNNVQCYRCKGLGTYVFTLPLRSVSAVSRWWTQWRKIERKSSQEAKEEEDEVEAVTSQSTPPWSRPDQERLHRRHRCRTLPQCPRPQGRETSCAPLWPAMSAGGEVGTPCPAMRQGRGKEEIVMESRRNALKQKNMFRKKNMRMSLAGKRNRARAERRRRARKRLMAAETEATTKMQTRGGKNAEKDDCCTKRVPTGIAKENTAAATTS